MTKKSLPFYCWYLLWLQPKQKPVLSNTSIVVAYETDFHKYLMAVNTVAMMVVAIFQINTPLLAITVTKDGMETIF